MLKKMLVLLAFLVLAISQPAYGHSSNQHWDSSIGYWVDNECNNTNVIDYEVIIYQYKNFNGLGLWICDGVKNLANFSFGNSSSTWDNKASGEEITFMREGVVCSVGFFDGKLSTGNFIYTQSDIPDLSVYSFDNRLTSIGKGSC